MLNRNVYCTYIYLIIYIYIFVLFDLFCLPTLPSTWLSHLAGSTGHGQDEHGPGTSGSATGVQERQGRVANSLGTPQNPWRPPYGGFLVS